ncbi:hypothetical protein [Marinilabilia salmonicolor]|uniref:hypothetical protein n=1 Tax=Marinilabilia salmonicolor TaxID=989 RepID=UPI001901FE0D|nr:hypothetical protein [Marinilabilia salmonicolor]
MAVLVDGNWLNQYVAPQLLAEFKNDKDDFIGVLKGPQGKRLPLMVSALTSSSTTLVSSLTIRLSLPPRKWMVKRPLLSGKSTTLNLLL